MVLTEQKRNYLEKLSTKEGVISALAFDQRGALKRLMAQYQDTEPTVAQMEELKVLVAEELTPFASSMLLDPEYGLPATKVLDAEAGLLLAYEKTGYDTSSTKRLPDCLNLWSAKRIKEQGADAVKFLLYYDVDSAEELNQEKQAYIERIGSECMAEEIPFSLEILAYDETIADAGSVEYAKVKPRKVIEAMKVFSDPRFNIDVLKVEVPVNVKYVEGFGDGEIVHSREEAAAFFKEQEEATNLPYIYLSAGVSAKLFQETLVFAHEAGANFNGVLCGRATWAGSVEYAKVKPRKVIEAMKVFSDPRFNIDVLKVEVPVNVKYVEGFGDGEVVHTKAEAAAFFKEQDEATNLPYIYLSAGVSAKLFQETLVFAHESGANFNGVLCGRATWAGSVKDYIEQGEEAARKWLRTTGFENIDELNKVLQKTATSWKERA